MSRKYAVCGRDCATVPGPPKSAFWFSHAVWTRCLRAARLLRILRKLIWEGAGYTVNYSAAAYTVRVPSIQCCSGGWRRNKTCGESILEETQRIKKQKKLISPVVPRENGGNKTSGKTMGGETRGKFLSLGWVQLHNRDHKLHISVTSLMDRSNKSDQIRDTNL